MNDENNVESKRKHEKRKAFVVFLLNLIFYFSASVYLALSGMILPAILTASLFCGCLYGFVGNLKDGWKSVDRKFPDPEHKIETDKPKEQTAREKRIIKKAELSLEILSALTLEATASIEDGFSSEAEKFYLSEESKNAKRCRNFRSEKEERWNRMLTDHVLGKLENEHADIFKAYKKGVEEFLKTEAKGPGDIYNAVKYGMLTAWTIKGTSTVQ